jgi:hypothetical protein
MFKIQIFKTAAIGKSPIMDLFQSLKTVGLAKSQKSHTLREGVYYLVFSDQTTGYDEQHIIPNTKHRTHDEFDVLRINRN